MNTHTFPLIIRRSLLLGACLGSLSFAFGQTTITDVGPGGADAFPRFDNYIRIGGNFNWHTGSATEWQTRNWKAKKAAGGVDDFKLTREIATDTVLTIDGRAVFGDEDYLARINITKIDTGSIDVGFRQYRTFYNGVGGFFPVNRAWIPIQGAQTLSVDRQLIWANATLALPDLPVFTFRYSYEKRDGEKDSTVWGESNLTGLPAAPRRRDFVGAWLGLEEHRHRLEGRALFTFGKTTLDVGLNGDWIDNFNTRNMLRAPFEAASRTIVSANGFVSNGWGADGILTVDLSEKVNLEGALAYKTFETELSGNRTFSRIVTIRDYHWRDLSGGSNVDRWTGRVMMNYRPTDAWNIQAGIRGESLDVASNAAFVFIGGLPPRSDPTTERTTLNESSWTPGFDIRFTGIEDVALYARVHYKFLDGDEYRLYLPSSAVTPPAFSSNLRTESASAIDDGKGRYVLGAGWYVNPNLTLRVEGFAKDNENKFIGDGARVPRSAGDQYVLGYKVNGIRFWAKAKPITNLSLTGRYEYREGKMTLLFTDPDTPGYANLPANDAMESQTHIVAGSLTFSPFRQFYLQGNANFVFSDTQTDYARIARTPTLINGGVRTSQVLRNAENNYFTLSGIAGLAVDKNTDVELQYTYFDADNLNDPVLARDTMVYGTTSTDYSVTLTVRQRLTERIMGTFKIGYFENRDLTSGGFRDFNFTMAYLALDYKLY